MRWACRAAPRTTCPSGGSGVQISSSLPSTSTLPSPPQVRQVSHCRCTRSYWSQTSLTMVAPWPPQVGHSSLWFMLFFFLLLFVLLDGRRQPADDALVVGIGNLIDPRGVDRVQHLGQSLLIEVCLVGELADFGGALRGNRQVDRDLRLAAAPVVVLLCRDPERRLERVAL